MIRQVISKSDPRVLVLAFLTLLAIIFCIYKMVGALTGSESTPEYQRTPPTAFAIPLVDTIVDPQKLTQPRLPDEAYLDLQNSAEKLGNSIAQQSIGVGQLRSAGLNPATADATLREIRSYYGLYRDRKTNPENIRLGSVSPDAAEVNQNFLFAAQGSLPGGSFIVNYQFSYENEQWNLDGLDISF